MLLEERVAKPTTVADAERLAREIYGIAATAKSLPGEYDDNFLLTKPASTAVKAPAEAHSYVLKVMHPAREPAFLGMQCQTLRHLARRAPQIALPRVVETKNGELFTSFTAADGSARLVWILTYVPGTVLAETRPHSVELLESLGKLLGEIDVALLDFSHLGAQRELKWDLSRAEWIREHLPKIQEPARRALVEHFLSLYEREIIPVMPLLRRSLIYGDANDFNVLVAEPWPQPRKVRSLIDFGDLHFGLTASEPAVAAAYAVFGKNNPIAVAAAVIGGYHSVLPLEEKEIGILFALMGMRLAVSVVNSEVRKTVKPEDAYVTVSEAPAWEALKTMAEIHPRFAEYAFRGACGLEPVPRSARIRKWLAAESKNAASILETDLRKEPAVVFDLSVGSTFLGADPKSAESAALTQKISSEIKRSGVRVGVGRYDEARLLYTSPLFGASANPTGERRTIHLGIDLFLEEGAPVFAPLEGVVHAAANNAAALDYGPVVILRHEAGEGQEFFTLYGHLSTDTLSHVRVGQKLERGTRFAHVGNAQENGGWPPHVHFQIVLDLLERGTDFPGVAPASQREVWKSLSLDPNLLLGIPQEQFPARQKTPKETRAERRALLGSNLSVSYEPPLKIVHGWMQHLYDETGRVYLDAYNNVPLVGHSHPRVVRAAQEQLALLNTNTRYLHDSVNRYAEQLTRLLPEPLCVCYFVNSGSEANELALRMARAHTGRGDVIVLEHAYHGHTNTLIEISPYKFNGPGGRGRKPWVHVAPIPDDYRGAYRRGDVHAGAKYAGHIVEILERMQGENRGVAAFIAETLPSVAGQIVFPEQYLAEVYRHVRAAGGVCIADEVQTGFGRLGAHFWGFEMQGVVPDIVVLGKPIGNGFPLGAVVATREIAASFDNGMEFFSTFGGNPVACAAGLAVLDVVEEEHLQKRARRVGNHLLAGLKVLQEKHELIGDVRGSGLFLGIDLVNDRDTREPASNQASYLVNRLRECGVLSGTDGPGRNVLKVRPPLIFSEADADLFAQTLGIILGEDAAQPNS